mmetsp:Transcript_94510/g.299971  ORF Transcript_94510/g.299971 Transcript_94510/m.299971 type:complete len:206 (+) Transcript_94510:533-1150(+)
MPLVQALPEHVEGVGDSPDGVLAQPLDIYAPVDVFPHLQVRGRWLKQVRDLFLVDLQVGALAAVLDAAAGLMALGNLAKDVVKKPAHDAAPLVGVHGVHRRHWSLDGVRLSASGLAVHVYAAVVPGEASVAHASTHEVEDLALGRRLAQHTVKGKGVGRLRHQVHDAGSSIHADDVPRGRRALPRVRRPHADEDADVVALATLGS